MNTDAKYYTIEPDGTITYHCNPDGSPLSERDKEICAEWNRERVAYRAVDYLLRDTKGLCKATRDFHRAWMYLCLRCSTQAGWVIVCLVVYLMAR